VRVAAANARLACVRRGLDERGRNGLATRPARSFAVRTDGRPDEDGGARSLARSDIQDVIRSVNGIVTSSWL
jgi:hypothetical protein